MTREEKVKQYPDAADKVVKIVFEDPSKKENVTSEEKMLEILDNSFAYVKNVILNKKYE